MEMRREGFVMWERAWPADTAWHDRPSKLGLVSNSPSMAGSEYRCVD